jgi:hypothetical protein
MQDKHSEVAQMSFMGSVCDVARRGKMRSEDTRRQSVVFLFNNGDNKKWKDIVIRMPTLR